MAEDAETALTEVQGGYVSAGYLTTSIVLMHEDQEQLQDWARDLRRTVQTLGFGCRIESINNRRFDIPHSTFNSTHYIIECGTYGISYV